MNQTREPNDVNVTTVPSRDNSSMLPVWVLGVLAAFISGVSMASCYWPMNWHMLAWVALVPWLVVGFGLLMGFSFRVARLLMDRFGSAAMLWAVPLAFTGQEILRSEALPQYRFSFLGLGYSQSHNLWIAQIASLGGVYFLTFLIAGFNSAVAFSLVQRRMKGVLAVVACGAVILILGWVSQPPSHDKSPSISVACVQAETYDYDTFATLTQTALENSDQPKLVVLPEHTIDPGAKEDHPLIDRLKDLARQHRAFIGLGADFAAAKGSACYFDNTGALISPEGTILLRQLKAVPIPLFQDGNPAREQRVAETPYGKIGMYICYDGMYTDVPRRLVEKGAGLLLCPVMDVQTWPAQERRQHADIAVMRSIELRRWVLRAASSGISQMIDPAGRITAQRTDRDGQGIVYGKAQFLTDHSPFVQGGHYFSTAVGYAFLALIAFLTLVPRRRINRIPPGPCHGTYPAGRAPGPA